MAFDVAEGTFTKSTSGAPVSQTVSGLGMTPKVLILWCTDVTVGSSFVSDYRFSFGFSDAVTDRAYCAVSEDALGTSNADRRHAAKALTMLDHTTTVQYECDVTSFSSGQFIINWTTNDARAVIIHYLALGGDDLTDVYVGEGSALLNPGGDKAYTGVGFQPDALIFGTVGTASLPPANVAAAVINIGMTDGTGQNSFAILSANAVATTNTGRTMRTDRVLYDLTTKAGSVFIRSQAIFASMDADGFTLTWGTTTTSTAFLFGYIALKGGGYKVGSSTSKTTPAGNKSVTGVGFTPTGMLLGSTSVTGTNVIGDHAHLSMGGASSATAESGTWVGDLHFQPTSVADMQTETAKIITMSRGELVPTVQAQGDINSFDSDGFTINWTTPASNRYFGYMCFGDAVTGAPAADRRRLAQVV